MEGLQGAPEAGPVKVFLDLATERVRFFPHYTKKLAEICLGLFYLDEDRARILRSHADNLSCLLVRSRHMMGYSVHRHPTDTSELGICEGVPITTTAPLSSIILNPTFGIVHLRKLPEYEVYRKADWQPYVDVFTSIPTPVGVVSDQSIAWVRRVRCDYMSGPTYWTPKLYELRVLIDRDGLKQHESFELFDLSPTVATSHELNRVLRVELPPLASDEYEYDSEGLGQTIWSRLTQDPPEV